MDNNKKVLVVEDEFSIRKFITINLKASGFEPIESSSGEEAISLFKEHNPDVVILDIMLPGIDGFEVLKLLRQDNSDVIIIMLTARSQDMDKITGLEIGADDYMIKPFNPLELIARIRAVLRRNGRNIKRNVLYSKNFVLDISSQKFFKGDREIELTPTEFSMVKNFIENKGNALSRQDILDLVWGENYFGDIKIVDVNVRRIREKIEDNPSSPETIETVWGYGYRWNGDK